MCKRATPAVDRIGRALQIRRVGTFERFERPSGRPFSSVPRRQNQSPNGRLGLWRFTQGFGPCSRTEHEHHHPFLAVSSSASGITVADLLSGSAPGLGLQTCPCHRRRTRRHRSRFSLLAGVVRGRQLRVFGQAVTVYDHPCLERKFRLRRSMISAT
jgi:hypothetical protein